MIKDWITSYSRGEIALDTPMPVAPLSVCLSNNVCGEPHSSVYGEFGAALPSIDGARSLYEQKGYLPAVVGRAVSFLVLLGANAA